MSGADVVKRTTQTVGLVSPLLDALVVSLGPPFFVFNQTESEPAFWAAYGAAIAVTWMAKYYYYGGRLSAPADQATQGRSSRVETYDPQLGIGGGAIDNVEATGAGLEAAPERAPATAGTGGADGDEAPLLAPPGPETGGDNAMSCRSWSVYAGLLLWVGVEGLSSWVAGEAAASKPVAILYTITITLGVLSFDMSQALRGHKLSNQTTSPEVHQFPGVKHFYTSRLGKLLVQCVRELYGPLFGYVTASAFLTFCDLFSQTYHLEKQEGSAGVALALLKYSIAFLAGTFASAITTSYSVQKGIRNVNQGIPPNEDHGFLEQSIDETPALLRHAYVVEWAAQNKRDAGCVVKNVCKIPSAIMTVVHGQFWFNLKYLREVRPTISSARSLAPYLTFGVFNGLSQGMLYTTAIIKNQDFIFENLEIDLKARNRGGFAVTAFLMLMLGASIGWAKAYEAAQEHKTMRKRRVDGFTPPGARSG